MSEAKERLKGSMSDNSCSYSLGRVDETTQRHSEPSTVPKVSISFRELHNSYGRPILTDFNSWKHEQRQKEKANETTENLISF